MFIYLYGRKCANCHVVFFQHEHEPPKNFPNGRECPCCGEHLWTSLGPLRVEQVPVSMIDRGTDAPMGCTCIWFSVDARQPGPVPCSVHDQQPEQRLTEATHETSEMERH